MLHTCKEKRLKLIEDAQAHLFAKTHEGSKRKCSYDFGFFMASNSITIVSWQQKDCVKSSVILFGKL